MFFLTMIHEYYGMKVILVGDRLSSHLSAQKFFRRTRPDWFVFENLPTYSPELNPVEQCWQMMKNVYMANFVPKDVEHLEAKAFEVAQIINKDRCCSPRFFIMQNSLSEGRFYLPRL